MLKRSKTKFFTAGLAVGLMSLPAAALAAPTGVGPNAMDSTSKSLDPYTPTYRWASGTDDLDLANPAPSSLFYESASYNTDGLAGGTVTPVWVSSEAPMFGFTPTQQETLNQTLDSMSFAHQVRFLENMHRTTADEQQAVIDALGAGATLLCDESTGGKFVLRGTDGSFRLLFALVGTRRPHRLHTVLRHHHHLDNATGDDMYDALDRPVYNPGDNNGDTSTADNAYPYPEPAM